jgi:TonB family protein
VPSAPRSARADDTAQTSLEPGAFAKPVKTDKPQFPRREAYIGIEGWVVVSYVIEPDGTVGEAIIENSSGRKGFEHASARAVENWIFKPATMNGEPVEQCHTRVRMLFELEQGSKSNLGAKKAFKNEYKKASQLLEKSRAWRIPPEWGDCSIYVFGEPGSTFQLLEYASTSP